MTPYVLKIKTRRECSDLRFKKMVYFKKDTHILKKLALSVVLTFWIIKYFTTSKYYQWIFLSWMIRLISDFYVIPTFPYILQLKKKKKENFF